MAGAARRSARAARQIVRLLRAANALASIKTVAAYGELFNSAYWASRPYRGTETALDERCLALAEYLTNDDRNGVFRRLASRLRVDCAQAPPAARAHSRGWRLHRRARRCGATIGVLQALRLALLQHMFLRAVQHPRVLPRERRQPRGRARNGVHPADRRGAGATAAGLSRAGRALGGFRGRRSRPTIPTAKRWDMRRSTAITSIPSPRRMRWRCGFR